VTRSGWTEEGGGQTLPDATCHTPWVQQWIPIGIRKPCLRKKYAGRTETPPLSRVISANSAPGTSAIEERWKCTVTACRCPNANAKADGTATIQKTRFPPVPLSKRPKGIPRALWGHDHSYEWWVFVAGMGKKGIGEGGIEDWGGASVFSNKTPAGNRRVRFRLRSADPTSHYHVRIQQPFAAAAVSNREIGDFRRPWGHRGFADPRFAPAHNFRCATAFGPFRPSLAGRVSWRIGYDRTGARNPRCAGVRQPGYVIGTLSRAL
jgi:hypothetical protein